MINVSVVIKAYNEEKHIANCIESVLKALKKVEGKNEIILVDSNSDDKTVDIAKKYPIKIIQLRKNWEKSAAAALQTGYVFSKGKFIYALDGDMTLDKNFINIALKEITANKKIAGIGGNMLLPKEDNILNKKAREIYKKNNKRTHKSKVSALAGGGLYKRSAIKDVKFLANPYLNCDEEAELGYRLKEKRYYLIKLDIPSFAHYGYNESPSKFISMKLKSGYFQGTGRLLRYYLGKKNFWKHLKKQKIRIFMVLWWPTFIISIILIQFIPIISYVYLTLSLSLYLFILLKKKSMSNFSYSILSWTLAGISIVIGFMKKIKNPESYPKNAIIIK